MKLKVAFALVVAFVISSTAFAFTDVSSSHVYSDAIDYAESLGIVQGYKDGTFRPDVPINRAEFTKVIIATEYDQETLDSCNTSKFTDVPDGAWYMPYICVAELEGIIDGYADQSFKPAQLINFAEASKILTNTLISQTNQGVPIWYETYVKSLSSKNAIPTSIDTFEHNITRGEMVEIIWRLKENITNLPSNSYDDLNGGIVLNQDEATFEIDMSNYEYSTTELRVKQGDKVTITLNSIVGTHNFIIDELDVASLTISSGNSTEVSFTATQKGTFEFYCSVGDHRALGMVGTLIVE